MKTNFTINMFLEVTVMDRQLPTSRTSVNVESGKDGIARCNERSHIQL